MPQETAPPLPLSLAQCATLACLLEVSAPKPGNVHRGADFEDLTYFDFIVSAAMIGPCFSSGLAAGNQELTVGTIVSNAVNATRDAVETNTNLGTLLLLAPLAMVPRETPLAAGIQAVLDQLSAHDTLLVYEAIRRAHPGGMGQVDQGDLANTPPDGLVAAMRLAEDRDLVARQYTNGFEQVFANVVPWLQEGLQCGVTLSDTIVWTHLKLMSQYPDSLIGRKCGREVARQSALMATAAVDAGNPGDDGYAAHLADLDFWLRSDSNRRNPGTTADLIAAGLFVCLREGVIRPPFSMFGEPG